jgi:hypothetical protein
MPQKMWIRHNMRVSAKLYSTQKHTDILPRAVIFPHKAIVPKPCTQNSQYSLELKGFRNVVFFIFEFFRIRTMDEVRKPL